MPHPTREEFDLITKTANLFLKNFGAAFTNTPKGHIETDIAGAASVAGLMILRATVPHLEKYNPGQVILSDLDEREQDVGRFVLGLAAQMLPEPQAGWQTPIPTDHQPMFETLELTRKLERPLLEACTMTRVPGDYYAHSAVYTAIKLVAAGHATKRLDPTIGKAIASYYLTAGARTVPHPLSG
jgi:hypothetical protein